MTNQEFTPSPDNNNPVGPNADPRAQELTGVVSGLFGLDPAIDHTSTPSTPGGRVDAALGIIIGDIAGRVYSTDPEERASGNRGLAAISAALTGRHEQSEDPAEKLANTAVSPLEMKGVLGSISQELVTPSGDALRAEYPVKQTGKQEADLGMSGISKDERKSEPVFTAEEEPIAALAIKVGMMITGVVERQNKLMSLDMILTEGRKLLEVAVLQNPQLVSSSSEGVPHLIEAVYAKLPGVVLATWDKQQRIAAAQKHGIAA